MKKGGDSEKIKEERRGDWKVALETASASSVRLSQTGGYGEEEEG